MNPDNFSDNSDNSSDNSDNSTNDSNQTSSNNQIESDHEFAMRLQMEEERQYYNPTRTFTINIPQNLTQQQQNRPQNLINSLFNSLNEQSTEPSQPSPMGGVNSLLNFLGQLTNIPLNQEDVSVVISEDSLEQLRLTIFKKIKDEEGIDITCSICMDDFDDDDIVRQAPCKHLFHRVCIDRWLKKENYKCPVCRKECGVGRPNI